VCTFRDGALFQEQTKINASDHNSTFKRSIGPDGKLIMVSPSIGSA